LSIGDKVYKANLILEVKTALMGKSCAASPLAIFDFRSQKRWPYRRFAENCSRPLKMALQANSGGPPKPIALHVVKK